MPGSEGRQTFRRRPLSHFTISNYFKHRIHTNSPRMSPAIMPKSELCRMDPISHSAPCDRNTMSALFDMSLSGLVPVSVSFYILLTDGSSQLASRSRSLTTLIPILLAVSTWNGLPTKSKSAVDLTVERKRCFQRTIMHGSNLGSCPGSTPYFKQTLLRRYNPVRFMLGRPC